MPETPDGKYRMYADFSKESYDAYKNGEAVSNNGFRSVKGNFMPDQPEFVEIGDEDTEDNNVDDSLNNITVAVTVATISTAAATWAVIKAAPHVKRWWNNKAVPEIKQKWNKIINNEKQMIEVKKQDSLKP